MRKVCQVPDDVPLHQDVHGLVVYEDSEPEPRFYSAGADVGLARSSEIFIGAFRDAFALSDTPTESQLLATEMYNLSHFESSSRAQFVSLVTAVECIAKTQIQPPEIVLLVERLLERAKADHVVVKLAKSNPPLHDSLLGRLRNLGIESIGKACERVVLVRLGDESRRQFKGWYGIRSEMVHAGAIPDGVNFESEVNQLDEMVSNLLLTDIQASRG